MPYSQRPYQRNCHCGQPMSPSTAFRATLRSVGAATLLALAAAGFASDASAQSLRYDSAFDLYSVEPHTRALVYQSRISTQVYEGLVNRDRDFRLEPLLALSWPVIDAKTRRFKLHPNTDGAMWPEDSLELRWVRLQTNGNRS